MEENRYPHIEESSVVASEPTASLSETYTIPRSHLFEMLSEVKVDDIPAAIKYLVDKLAIVQKSSIRTTVSHKWDKYQLSEQVIAMAPSKRKNIYGDYDSELLEVLEEKYK